MTPPYRRCFLFLADGARPDIFEDLLERGQLSAIQEHIVGPGTCTRAVSVFPSTTGPAYLPFLTGCFPGPANMPGIRWFDRQAYQEGGVWGLDSCRSYVGPASYLMNRDFNAPATLFELFDRPVNIFSSINRGIGFSNNKGKILRSLLWLWGHYTDHWGHVDQAAGVHPTARPAPRSRLCLLRLPWHGRVRPSRTPPRGPRPGLLSQPRPQHRPTRRPAAPPQPTR